MGKRNQVILTETIVNWGAGDGDLKSIAVPISDFGVGEGDSALIFVYNGSAVCTLIVYVGADAVLGGQTRQCLGSLDIAADSVQVLPGTAKVIKAYHFPAGDRGRIFFMPDSAPAVAFSAHVMVLRG